MASRRPGDAFDLLRKLPALARVAAEANPLKMLPLVEASLLRTQLMRTFLLLLASAATLLLGSPVLAQPADCKNGLQEIERKNYAPAVELLSKCLALPLQGSARAFVLSVRAQANFELKRFSLALKDQQESLALEEPKDVWPWIMLAVYHRELKQLDEALAALRSAQDYDEDGPGTGPGMAVHYHTGQTLHAAGRYAEAVEAYTKGIPKQPDFGYALYKRALSHEAMGNQVQAKRDLFRAAELVPKDGYEADVAAKLKEYGFEVKVRRD